MDIVEDICEFIEENGSGFFEGWTREAVEDYITFHLDNGSISVAIDPQQNVVGIMVGWRQKGSAHVPFRWQHADPEGDHFWIDHFMAVCPCAAAAIAIAFCERHPVITEIPTAGFRNGRLRVYPPGHLLKIYLKAEALYGHKR